MIFEKAELVLMLKAIQNLNIEMKTEPMSREDREVMQDFMSKLHQERRRLDAMVDCEPCHGVGFIHIESDFDGLTAEPKCTNCFGTGRVDPTPYDSAMMDPESER